MRVVSLVPSLTELVFYLGRGEWLVGRTRFCALPAEARRVEAVGGTKDPDIARIAALAPDLVIANREENRRQDVEALRAAGLDVLVTDPNTVREAAAMIEDLGRRLVAEPPASALVDEILGELEHVPPGRGPRVFVAVWYRPLMGLGSQTYGNDVVAAAGAVNVLAGRPRYPELDRDELAALRPDLILLPDEPYRFRQRHAEEFSAIAPARVVDGKLLWWYGPRLPGALRELRRVFASV
jgi:ABC-type Fe3+-hydroxamate transport system substrate-binding protein